MGRFSGYTDLDVFSLLKQGNAEAFDEIYNRYWEKLFNYVFHRTASKDVAFEIVQDIFVSLWSRRAGIDLRNSLSGYLFASVRLQIITYIRNSSAREHYLRDYIRFVATSDNSNEEAVLMRDLERALQSGIDALPERCREITRMSMIQHLPAEKIAERLKISQRTVENQLALARTRLKISLGDFVTLYLIFNGLS